MKMILLLALALALGFPAIAEEFILEINGSNVSFINNAAIFNCGSEIAAEMEVHSGTIKLTELEVLLDPQYCICFFDLIIDFTLEAGEYALQVWRWEYWQEEPVMVWATDFEIAAPGYFTLPQVLQSACGGWTSDLPEGPPMEMTWSAIRALY